MKEQYPDLSLAGSSLAQLDERARLYELQAEMEQQEKTFQKVMQEMSEENYNLRHPEIKLKIGTRFVEDASGECTFLANGDERKISIFMEAVIKKVTKVHFGEAVDLENFIRMEIQIKGEEKTISIPVSLLEKEKNLMSYFQSEVGVKFNQKGSAKRRRELLQALIMEKAGAADTEICIAKTGWTEKQGKYFYKTNEMGDAAKIKNQLEVMKKYNETFEVSNESVVMLAFNVNSILKSLLLKKGIAFSKVLVLSGDLAIVNSWINKILITPKDVGIKKINLNDKNLEKELVLQRDTSLVIVENNALGPYQREKKENQIHKLVHAVCGMEVEAKVRDKNIVKRCECNVCLISAFSGIKFFQKNAIQINCTGEMHTSDSDKVFFNNFVAFVSNNMESILERIEKIKKEPDEEPDEFALKVSLEVLEWYVNSFGCSFLGEGGNMIFDKIHDIFIENRVLNEYDGMTNQVRFALEGWIKSRKLKIQNLDVIEETSTEEKKMYVDETFLYISNEDFKQLLEESFPDDDPAICFLRALTDDGFLEISTKGNTEYAKKVYIPEKGERVRMLHIKRELVESQGMLPIL